MVLHQARKYNFKYVYAFPTSGKSRMLFEQFNMKVVASIDAQEFEFNGMKPFSLVEKESRSPCIMWQRLDQMKS